MPHITNIQQKTTKVDLVPVTKDKKPKLPQNLIEKLLRAAMDDAAIASTYSCEVLNKFEKEHGCEVSDVSYRDGILSLRINEKYNYNFRVELTEIK